MMVNLAELDNKFFFGAYKNNKCYLGYCDMVQDRVVDQFSCENEPINGIDSPSSGPSPQLYFCTNDDLVAGWDFRIQDGGISKLGFRGSNPQDIKCSPTNPFEIAVCDDRKSLFVIKPFTRYSTSESQKKK